MTVSGRKPGLVIDAYFSATKLKWILDEVPACASGRSEAISYFGTVEMADLEDDKGKRYMSPITNASRTMLFNIHTLKWGEGYLKRAEHSALYAAGSPPVELCLRGDGIHIFQKS